MPNKEFPTDYTAASALTGTETFLADQSGTKKVTATQIATFTETGSTTEPTIYLSARFTVNFGDTSDAARGLALLAGPSALSMSYCSNAPCWTPTTAGHFRDPSIIYWAGTYFVAYTAGNYGGVTYFGLLSSTNLVDWTALANVSLGKKARTWAPEFFADGDTLYVVVGSNDAWGADGDLWLMEALNDELTAWGTPVAITGFSGVPVNDACIRKSGSTYYMAATTAAGTKIYTASAVAGPYSVFTTSPTTFGGEGTCITELDDGTWLMTVDNLSSWGVTNYYVSSDGMATWSAVADYVNMPHGLRHGTTIMLKGWNHFRTIATAALCAPMWARHSSSFAFPGYGQSGLAVFDGSYDNQVQTVGAGVLSYLALDVTPQALTGAGAVNLTSLVTRLTTTGPAQAITLANSGLPGQPKTIIHEVDGGSAVLTASASTGWTTITFTNVGDAVKLVFFDNRGWMIESVRNATVA